MYSNRRCVSGTRVPTANPDKLRLLLSRRKMSLERLAEVVGTSVLYSALFVPDGWTNRAALTSLCLALRCRMDELTDAGPSASPSSR